MSIGFLFWLLMVLDLVFGFWWWTPWEPANRGFFGGHLFIWVLLALLGWHAFGFILHA